MISMEKIKNSPLYIKFSFILALIFILTIILADFIMPYDPNANNLMNVNQPPVFLGGDWNHILGTDQLGRDTLSRNIYGLRVSAGIAIFGLIIGCVVGVVAGLISGYVGGIVDKIIMAIVDFQLSIPYTLILLLGVVIFGTDIFVLIALVGLAKWETYARIIRGLVLSIRENQYVESAQVSGGSTLYIISKHILPNVLPTIFVMLTLNFPAILSLESTISFLGIGIQPPIASLGRMVGDGRDYLLSSWWVSVIPSVIIIVMTLTMQALGDWLRDAMNIKTAVK